MLAKLVPWIARERLLFERNREIRRLRDEVDALRLQNEKINRAMRRCLTCEYRIESIAR